MVIPLSFYPSPASVPPANVVYRLKEYPDTPVNSNPLVNVLSRSFVSYLISWTYDLQNPLDFILHAAQIYPDKVALVHPNVEYPVQYTFSVWYEESSTSYIVSSQRIYL